MENDDIEKNCKILHEILLGKDFEIVKKIKSIKLSAISESARCTLSQTMMKHIRESLRDWEMLIPTFDYITSSNICTESFRYLLEIIQNEKQLDFDRIMWINDKLRRSATNTDIIHDCLEHIPELIDTLGKVIEEYNTNPDKRMQIIKDLKKFATDVYLILNNLSIELQSSKPVIQQKFQHSIMEYINKLLNLSFVISEYPPKIIKKATSKQTGTRFQATVSCLIDQDNLFSSKLVSQIYILNETDFQNYLATKTLNKQSSISFKDTKNNNNWTFKNMILEERSRQTGEKRKSERVTNIKSIILFVLKITANPYAFKNFEINIKLYSDPVIAVVHSNQEVDAQMTLFWDDYFRIDKASFPRNGTLSCKESVTNRELISAISDHFYKQTTRGLTPSNKEFLERKLSTCTRNGMVTFQCLTRTSIPDSQYSFGSWIFHIIKLLKVEGTFSMWKHDLIDGFVSKDSGVYFRDAAEGTFFLRFSERNPTIGVVVNIGNNNDAWSPFDIVECRSRSLPERLMDYAQLNWIRNANGELVNKSQRLQEFITDQKLEEGYTPRGQCLLNFIDNYIYGENLENSPEIDILETMDSEDLFPELS